MRHIIFIKDGRAKGLDAISTQIRGSNDGIYTITMTKQKSQATTRMHGYLYGYVYAEILKEMGQQPTVEAFNELDRMLKLRFGAAETTTTYELRRKKEFSTGGDMDTGNTGRPFVKIEETMKPKSKADYTVQEMQDYWTALQELANQMWGMVLKDPDPNWQDGWNDKKTEIENDYIQKRARSHFGLY